MSQPERKLGTWPIFIIAVSAMTPLTVVAGALPLGYGQVEEKGIPVAYMLVAAVLGIFAVGLAAMARHVPNSGAFYAYASIGISRPVGVGTAFVALLAYNAMQIGLYGAFGVATHNALAIFGVEISWIICALIGWAVIAILGRLDIDLNARILTVLVCAELLIVLIFDAVMIGNPAGGTVTFATLNPALIATAGGVSLLVAAIAGMVGFEAPLVYAAEARDPRRTIARAIGYTLLVAAVLYGGTAWAMSVVAGPDNIVAVAGEHLSDLFFFLPEPYLPKVVLDIGQIFFATSLFAAMLAFHHTVARYALTVAREGVLPAGLARTRGGVPVAASVAQSALAAVVLVIFAIGVWNPTTDLFFFGTVSGGLGVLVLMTIAAVAVIRFFRRGPLGETRWRRAIAPWISAVFLSLVLLVTIAFFGELLDTDNPAKIWSPILAFLLALVAGIVWGRKLRRERPDVFAVIGTGRPPLAPGEAPPPVVTDGAAVPGPPSLKVPGSPSAPIETDSAPPASSIPSKPVGDDDGLSEPDRSGTRSHPDRPGTPSEPGGESDTGSTPVAPTGDVAPTSGVASKGGVAPAGGVGPTTGIGTTTGIAADGSTAAAAGNDAAIGAAGNQAAAAAAGNDAATAAAGNDAATAATGAGEASDVASGTTGDAGTSEAAPNAAPAPRQRTPTRRGTGRPAADPPVPGATGDQAAGPSAQGPMGNQSANGAAETTLRPGAPAGGPAGERPPTAEPAATDPTAESTPAARARTSRRPAPRPRSPQPTDTSATADPEKSEG
ncbi:amino acid permease [Actinoplanes sp. NPDC023801]|uniref:APC family permease n=1 Tax=Actinoplanes sp. NPDC023801 TaxID=3154595 RepID=UPI0033CD7C22